MIAALPHPLAPAHALRLLTILVAASAWVPAQLTISSSSPLDSAVVNGGFAPNLITLVNERNEKLRLTLEASTRSFGSRVLVSRQVELAPNGRAEIEFPVPVGATSGVMITSKTFGQMGYLTLRTPSLSTDHGYISRSPKSNREGFASVDGEWKHLCMAVATDSSRTAVEELNAANFGELSISAASFAPKDLPTTALGYTAIDVVAIEESILTALDAARRSALEAFVDVGGTLIVWDVASFDDLGALLEGLRTETPRPTGPIVVMRRLLGKVAFVRGDNGPFLSQPCLRVLKALSDDGDPASLIAANRVGHKRPNNFFGFRRREGAVVVPGVENLPVRLFAFLIVAFAILVGPLNLFVFRKGHRRLFILVTIPALSLLVSAGLLAFALLGEGLSVKVVTRSLAYLDQVNRRAAQVTTTGYYAGLAPSGGLRFSADTAATDPRAWMPGRERSILEVSLDDGLRLESGWLPARTPREMLITTARPCRDRIEIEAATGATLPLTNGLSTHIRRIIIRTPSGELFVANDIAPGQRQSAILLGSNEDPMDIKTLVDEEVFATFTAADSVKPLLQDSTPRPGEFFAITDTPVLSEFGVEDPQMLPGVNLLLGRYTDR